MIWAEAHKKHEACLVALILVAQLGLLIAAARANDPVADERSTYLYGQRILNEGRFDRARNDRTRIFNSKMPVAALAALPQYLAEQAKVWPFTRLGESIGPVNPRHPHIAYKFWSRLAVLSLAPLLGLVGYLWSRRLYGRGPALVVLLLLTLSPNLSAFLGLILNDGPAIIAFFGAIFLFRRFSLAPSPGRLIWAGAGLGLALLTKNSTVMIPPLVCLAWGLEKWPDIRTLLARRDWTGLVKGIRFCLISLTGWLIAAGLVLNTGFGWQGFGHTLAGIKPQSAVLRHLPPALQALPLPLPRAFTVGLDMIRYDDQNAETNSMIYFNGLRRHFSPPEYFAVGLGLKLPLAILILLGWAAIRKWSRDSTPDDPWLIVPVVVLGLQISFGMGLGHRDEIHFTNRSLSAGFLWPTVYWANAQTEGDRPGRPDHMDRLEHAQPISQLLGPFQRIDPVQPGLSPPGQFRSGRRPSLHQSEALVSNTSGFPDCDRPARGDRAGPDQGQPVAG